MSDKFSKTLMILGILLAILGIVLNKNIGEVFLNITIILWISNVYLLQTQLDKLEDKK